MTTPYRTIRKRRADGSVVLYYYHRLTGRPILGTPGTTAFQAALGAAGAETGPPAGSVGRLLQDYQQSREWRALAPATRAIYERGLARLASCAKLPVKELTAKQIRSERDELDETPGTANQFVGAVSALLTWAMRSDDWELEFNVCRAVRPLPGGHWKRWPEDRVRQFEAALPELPRDVRLGWSLLLYTGQRRGDVLKMGWSDYDPAAFEGYGAIQTLQQKTGEGDDRNTLWIPVHPTLRALLDAEKPLTNGLAIVSAESGAPYWQPGWHRNRQAPFYARMRAAQARVFGAEFYPLHGLRTSAANRLAEAGCTPHEIMSITGHRNLATVELYTRQAEQRSNALAAMRKLAAQRRA